MHIVSGGAGFVASHLVDALVEKGNKVRIIDNFSRGSLANLHNAIKTGGVQFQKTNLENHGIPISGVDTVWHFAAKVAGIEYNRHNQYDMLATNLAINANVIESVRRQKPRLFVYVSTACVYAKDAPVPTPESAGDICNPEPTNHGYGVAKWVGEQMIKHLYREHNQACLIVRFFNVIGRRDYYDKAHSHVVPALIRRVEEGENPIKVWGSGNQTRSFVDARDIAKAVMMLSLAEEAHDARPINIGHEHEVSIAELVETIVQLSGKDTGYEFDTTKPDGHARRAPDVTRLRSLISWVPDMPLEQSVKDMFVDYRERHA
jgi:nucleoside-diphosphate-sugar epimerase